MVKFANDCLKRLQELIHERLVDRLGLDTADLTMRFGLNSGEVTAGVLRGTKSRFQIFGDTVNTAARMESNGLPGKIHVSEVTAHSLMEGGKENWVQPRTDVIQAKGKGSLQTYWVNVAMGNSRSGIEGSGSATNTHGRASVRSASSSN